MIRKDLSARASHRIGIAWLRAPPTRFLIRLGSPSSFGDVKAGRLALARRQTLIINTRGGAYARAAAASIHVFFLGAPRETGWNSASERRRCGEKEGRRRRVVESNGAPAVSKSRYLRPLSVTAVKRSLLPLNLIGWPHTISSERIVVSPLPSSTRGKRGVARDRFDFRGNMYIHVCHLNGKSTIKRLKKLMNLIARDVSGEKFMKRWKYTYSYK